MGKVAVVTGTSGGIGRALCTVFDAAGYEIVAVDLRHTEPPGRGVVQVGIDLDRYCSDAAYRTAANAELGNAIGDRSLAALVNNAAVQIIKPVEKLTPTDWTRTLNVNLLAPFLLTQGLLAKLEAACGSVVNISSIHASLTKPHFAAYSTSKAALDGLTRALAVELGNRVTVNAIAPAAIATPMLVEGFEGCDGELDKLGECHPVGRIGEPDEVAQLALYLVSAAPRFLTGATVRLDGGIGACLHDPS